MVTAKYPDIKIELQTTAFGDYWTKLPVLAASNQLPDIVSMQSLRMKNFYSILEPLDERIKADKFDIDAFEPSIIANMQEDGATYALPYDNGPWVVYYNQDMFEAAGVPLPKPGWTQAEFLATAKALTKDGKYGFGIAPLNWFPIALGDGADYLNADGELDLTNEAFVKATQWYLDLVTKEKVAAPVPASAAPDAITLGAFDSGAAAMYIDGPWMVIGKDVKFKFGLATQPAGSAGGKSMTAGSGFGVAASSQHKDEAWKAIQVLTSPEALEYLGKEGRALPARKAQQELWYNSAAKNVTGARETLSYEFEHAVPYRITENWNQVENLFNQYMPLAFGGSQDAKQVLEQIQTLSAQ
jgi:multiple sugar transport system substrate-binding protein